MILVDTNVVIDLSAGGDWSDWSQRAVNRAQGEAFINHIVLAEISPGFATQEAAVGFVEAIGLPIIGLDDAAAFRAGRAHALYRRQVRDRSAVLADFLIGAHASVLGATLLTRDRQRFASYFPELTLIAPETKE
jgi:hypothetical protein